MKTLKALFTAHPIIGVRFPVSSNERYTFSMATPLLVHFVVALCVVGNIILWPIVGIIVAIRIIQ